MALPQWGGQPGSPVLDPCWVFEYPTPVASALSVGCDRSAFLNVFVECLPMRWPRVRFTVRWLMGVVAVTAVLMGTELCAGAGPTADKLHGIMRPQSGATGR